MVWYGLCSMLILLVDVSIFWYGDMCQNATRLPCSPWFPFCLIFFSTWLLVINDVFCNVVLSTCFCPIIWFWLSILKLPSLFDAWLFWTFHTKSHNMKALVISKSFIITISPTYLFIWKKWTFVCLCVASWRIFLRKKLPQITHVNHMTMTTSGQI